MLRLTLLLEFALVAVCLALLAFGQLRLPVELQTYLDRGAHHGWAPPSLVGSFITIPLAGVHIASAVALWLFRRWARFPYAISSVWAFVGVLFGGPPVQHASQYAVEEAWIFLSGISCALSYYAAIDWYPTTMANLRRSSNVGIIIFVTLVVGVAIYLPLRQRWLSTPRQTVQTQTDSWEAVRTAMDHIDYDKASSIAERILKRYPNDYLGYAYLGNIALAADRIEDAERSFARAYDLLPSEENEKMLRAVRKRIESEKPIVTQ